MKFPVYRFNDKEIVGEIEVDPVFNDASSVDDRFIAMHFNRMKAAHLSCRKAKVKNQSEVSGTTAKPYKQKGTGRARRGTMRAAHHIGGGTIFGPRGLSKKVKIPKGEARLAKKAILSKAVNANRFFVLENVDLPDHKTKNSVKALSNFAVEGAKKFLILHNGLIDKNNLLSGQNVRGLKYANVSDFTTYDIMHADVVLVLKDGVLNLMTCLK